MLQEVKLHRQDEPNRIKRWFQDGYFDVYTWQNPEGEFTAFQLCYDRKGLERVISWDRRHGFEHSQIDDGEASPHRNMTPVFTNCTIFSENTVIKAFEHASRQIDTQVSQFIVQQLRQFLQAQAQLQPAPLSPNAL